MSKSPFTNSWRNVKAVVKDTSPLNPLSIDGAGTFQHRLESFLLPLSIPLRFGEGAGGVRYVS
jgi:hypothetical protein